jgi:hypothetical protein
VKQLIGFLGLMFLCIYLIYLNISGSQPVTSIDSIETGAAVQVDSETNEELSEVILPELEYMHEESEDEEVDGYIVETYREYEIYKDQEGNIIKQVPTSNFDYIRYRK